MYDTFRTDCSLILCGCIRGLIEGCRNKKKAQNILGRYETSIRQRTGCAVCIFKFEGESAMFLTGVKGNNVLHLATKIASAVAKESGNKFFYHTCSFWVSLSEASIPEDVRRARVLIDNHQEGAGIFYLDGRMFPVRSGSVPQTG